ncbi:CPBP family intramembrane glutamic endopeptidase [Lysinibacillus piscis]|uniref:CAAX amino protease n=1 Tax=Lysinibacillus piscis TaxID=2518931 RepID=A0ABQ5NI43_9BACI|nr:CPBP family intramembrane glutamic endopeptidase [Lysinibacillus sp. KH24]GLC88035.1 CAAX amino protease [Lysinibacillus sp. KH24]
MRTTQNIIIFIVIVLLCGWLGVLVDQFIPNQPKGNTLGMGLWLVLPLLATILLRTFAGDGWHDTGLAFHLKGNGKWYIVAFLIYPITTAILLLFSYLTGWMDFSHFNMYAVASAFASSFFLQFIKNIFEESVWRGYLTSKLLQLKLNDFWLYMTVGGVWGAWHLPYFLVFLPATDIANVLPVNRLSFAIIGIMTMIIWTIMYTEIYLLTKSIWPLVIMHATEDALINPLMLEGYIQIAQGKEFFVSPTAGIVTTLLYLGIGLLLRAYRKKRDLVLE